MAQKWKMPLVQLLSDRILDRVLQDLRPSGRLIGVLADSLFLRYLDGLLARVVRDDLHAQQREVLNDRLLAKLS